MAVEVFWTFMDIYFRQHTDMKYECVSKSFRTESQLNKQQKQALVEKQYKGLWRQNSLD
jgi:hypothetical protein